MLVPSKVIESLFSQISEKWEDHPEPARDVDMPKDGWIIVMNPRTLRMAAWFQGSSCLTIEHDHRLRLEHKIFGYLWGRTVHWDLDCPMDEAWFVQLVDGHKQIVVVHADRTSLT